MKSHHFLITVAVFLSVLVQPIRAAEPIEIDESPVISSTQVVSDTSQVFVEIIAPALNIRGGPGVDYPALGSFAKGEQPEVIGYDSRTSWLQVKFVDDKGDEQTGWISGSEKWVKQVDLTNVPEITEIPDLSEQLAPKPAEQPQVEQQPEVVLSPEQQDFETRFENWRQWIQKNGSRFIMVGGVYNMNKMIGYEHLTASQARDQFLDTIRPVLEMSPKEFQDLIMDNTRYLRVFEPVGAYAGRRAMTTTNEDTVLPHDAFTKPCKGVGMFANLIAVVSSMVHEATHNKAGTVANQADACSAAGDFLEFWIPKLEPGQDRGELENRLTWIRSGACGKTP